MTLDIVFITILTYIIALISIYIFYGNNLIFIFIALEIIFLTLAILATVQSLLLDNIFGINLALLMIPLAGVESAIALSLLVAYYTL